MAIKERTTIMIDRDRPEVERAPEKAAGSGTRAAQRRNPGTSHGGR